MSRRPGIRRGAAIGGMLIAASCLCVVVTHAASQPSLAAKASAARSLNAQTFAVARDMLRKSRAPATGGDRSTLYDQQIETATWLLTASLNAGSDSDRAQLRKDVAQTSLDYLRSLEARLREVATDQRPAANVMPPVSGGGPVFAGMSPQAIKDPQARRAYQDAIHANSELAARVREQETLESGRQRLSMLIKNFIETRYAQPPENSAERAQWLAELDVLK